MISYLVTWCFKPSQEQRITSGLKEAFTQRYIVESLASVCLVFFPFSLCLARQTEEAVGRQHQGMDRPGVCQVQRAAEKGKMEETGCKIICGAPIPFMVKGWMR